MIFEVLATADDETVIVSIDTHTYNQIIKMLVVESYHKGKSERLNDEINEE